MSTPQQDLIDTLTEQEWDVLMINTPIKSLTYWDGQPIAALENVIRAVRHSLKRPDTRLSQEARDSLFGDGTK